MSLFNSLGSYKKIVLLIVLVFVIIVAITIRISIVSVTAPPKISNQTNQSIKLLQTIEMPGVTGRIDHMALDVKNHRLFIAALGHDSVEVIDLDKAKDISSIRSLNEPQGIIFIPSLSKLYVANGGNGKINVLDTNSLTITKTISLSSDADNIIYDKESKLVYVGFGDGAIAIINSTNEEVIGSVQLNGHPESFTLDAIKQKLFVNVPQENSVSVIDLKKQSVINKLSFESAHQNFPMAFDEKHHRLFVGYRDPPKLVVFDTDSNTTITNVDIVKDPDDIFYDSNTGKIYVSGGEGLLYVIKQHDPDTYKLVDKIPTTSGARTSLFSPDLKRLYVAAPKSLIRSAEILVYEVN